MIVVLFDLSFVYSGLHILVSLAHRTSFLHVKREAHLCDSDKILLVLLKRTNNIKTDDTETLNHSKSSSRLT